MGSLGRPEAVGRRNYPEAVQENERQKKATYRTQQELREGPEQLTQVRAEKCQKLRSFF